MRAVLILTRATDSHLAPIADAIRARGAQVVHCNVADFPEAVTLTTTLSSSSAGWVGTLTVEQQSWSLDSFTSIWRRRPRRYQAPEGYACGVKAFIEEEADAAFIGVLESLTVAGTLWVSRTHSVRRADLKPLQLAVAQHLGLRVPRTLITNEPSAVQSFIDVCGGKVVLKAVARGMIQHEAQHIERTLYTTLLEAHQLEETPLAGVRVTAHLLQEYLPKREDIRVVVIGKQVFAVAMETPHSEDAHEQAPLDFRQAYARLRYRVHRLPDEIEQKALALVRSFELQFSSMDFVLTPDGEYVFVDLNPNGQFYWLQVQLADRLPLKEAMANLLVSPEDYRL